MTYVHPDPAVGLSKLLMGAQVTPSDVLTTGMHLPINERGEPLSKQFPFAEFHLTPSGSPQGARMAREVQVSVHGAEHQTMQAANNIVTFLSGPGVMTPEGLLDRVTVDQHPHHLPSGPLSSLGIWTCAFTLICRTRGLQQRL